MNCLDLLEGRVSVPLLEEPAPPREVVERSIRAAIRAPDHGQLRPWRFLTIQGDALDRLGELFQTAGLAGATPPDEKELAKLLKMPRRAPMVIVAIARLQEHPKVPASEQRLSAGAAVMNMMLSLHAQGYASMWRTGWLAYDARVAQGLGLSDNEEIVGFIYVGTAAGRDRQAPQLNPADFYREWNG